MNRNIIAGCALASILATSPALADETADNQAKPLVSGELELDFAADWTLDSGDPTAEIVDLYPEGALAIAFNPTHWLAVNLGLTFEPVLDPQPSTNRYFGDLGLYVDTLNIEIEKNGASLVAGKFGPGFGQAWEVTPGVYGTGFAEDYELSEMIGFGVAYEFDAGNAGMISVGGNVFFADTSILSDSAFTSRGRTSLTAGGPGNTGKPNNFSITLDGFAIPAMDGLSWHTGYVHLSAGAGDVSDVNGVAVGALYESTLSGGIRLGLNGELAYFDGVGGTGDRAFYATGGVSLANGPWHAEFATTFRQTRYFAGGSDNDFLAQASAGYRFENDFDVSAGYVITRESGVTSHTAGLRIAKSFGFEIAR